MRVYISGPLQGSTDIVRARSLYVVIAKVLKEAGHEAYVPHLHTDPERAADVAPETVFETDVRELLAADAIVAHVGAPSTGVGAELAIASREGKQIVALHRTTEAPSRFAVGLVLAAGGAVVAFDGAADLRDGLLRQIGRVDHPRAASTQAIAI